LITADGPKGPAQQVKDGVLRLAQKTGSVIVPIGWHASRVKVFTKTWDQFQIPLPFSRIIYAYGKPVAIPDAPAGKDDHPLKQQLKQAIDRLEEDVVEACQGSRDRRFYPNS
jgi:lysophospholipid acyltransferase (LPLAT)-like uncharacterized protein